MIKNTFMPLTIFGILTIIYFLNSETTFKIHFLSIATFFASFVIPAFFIRSREFLKEKKIFFLLPSLCAIIIYDIVSAELIVKREFFMGAFFLYPFGVFVIYRLMVFSTWLNQKLKFVK